MELQVVIQNYSYPWAFDGFSTPRNWSLRAAQDGRQCFQLMLHEMSELRPLNEAQTVKGVSL